MCISCMFLSCYRGIITKNLENITGYTFIFFCEQKYSSQHNITSRCFHLTMWWWFYFNNNNNIFMLLPFIIIIIIIIINIIIITIFIYNVFHVCWTAGLRDLVGSALDHRSLPPEFESRRGHTWRVFHLLLRFITFGGRLAHLAYHVHKSGRKTAIIIIIIWSEHLIKNILIFVIC